MAEEMKQVIEASHKRRLQGVVVSHKRQKTIVVETENYKAHPIYKKRVSVRKRYKVDDRNDAARSEMSLSSRNAVRFPTTNASA